MIHLNHLLLALLLCAVCSPAIAGEEYVMEKGDISGYGQIGIDRVSSSYGGGFSMYTAVWPLVEQYPGNRYQTGLFHTWMFARYDPNIDTRGMYSDIEGGLGWWRDTRFATETPKFIMGGVALNFSEWANGPGAGKGRNWENPKGKYAVVQLSSRVLWPPDGLNFKQGTCGDLFGYGYRPLPLLEPKTSTYGKPAPTGNQCWTLFINARNAKGPVAFFLPEFFSRPSINETRMAGQFLDTRPANPNRHLSMETQHIPAVLAHSEDGKCYAKVDQILFPGTPQNTNAPLVHNVTAYKNAHLWKALEAWFQGGDVAPSEFANKSLTLHSFTGKASSSWTIQSPSIPKNKRRRLDWDSFMKPVLLDKHTFSYQWNEKSAFKSKYRYQTVFKFPQYFMLKGTKWIPIPEAAVPDKSGLLKYSFQRTAPKPPKPYITPETKGSPWKKPGPASGPHKAKLGDGSIVTYFWYRFADQPAIQKAALTLQEREVLQKKVERLHRHWTLEKTYIPEPEVDTPLAQIDPALVVKPPKQLGIGYVPIVTRQEKE